MMGVYFIVLLRVGKSYFCVSLYCSNLFDIGWGDPGLDLVPVSQWLVSSKGTATSQYRHSH